MFPRLALGLMFLALADIAVAAEVYRWVDQKGVTHYGEQPPEGSSAERAFTMPDTAPVSDANDEYFSVINQSRRMEESRLAREKARSDLTAERRASQPVGPNTVYLQGDGYGRGYGYAYPVYPYPRPPIHGKPGRASISDCRTSYIGCPKYLPPNPRSNTRRSARPPQTSLRRGGMGPSQPRLRARTPLR